MGATSIVKCNLKPITAVFYLFTTETARHSTFRCSVVGFRQHGLLTMLKAIMKSLCKEQVFVIVVKVFNAFVLDFTDRANRYIPLSL